MTTSTEWDAVRSSVETRLETATNENHRDALAGVLEHTSYSNGNGKTDDNLTVVRSYGKRQGRLLSEISEQEKPWIIPGKLIIGGITIWYGLPGCGKSSASCEFIARHTQGWKNPDGSDNEFSGPVVTVMYEDSLEYTVVGRLKAFGAKMDDICDLSKVRVDDTKYGTGTLERRFSLFTDLPILRDTVRAMKASLVVLDPMSALFDGMSNYNNQKIGQCLDNVRTWAEDEGVAVLIIGHTNKDGKTLAGGAQFERAARIIFHFAQDPTKQNLCVVTNTKNNLAMRQGNMAFTQKTDGLVEWVHGEEPAQEKVHNQQRWGDLRKNVYAMIESEPQRLFRVQDFADVDSYVFSTVKDILAGLCTKGLIIRPSLGKYASILYTPTVPENSTTSPTSPTNDIEDEKTKILDIAAQKTQHIDIDIDNNNVIAAVLP